MPVPAAARLAAPGPRAPRFVAPPPALPALAAPCHAPERRGRWLWVGTVRRRRGWVPGRAGVRGEGRRSAGRRAAQSCPRRAPRRCNPTPRDRAPAPRRSPFTAWGLIERLGAGLRVPRRSLRIPLQRSSEERAGRGPHRGGARETRVCWEPGWRHPRSPAPSQFAGLGLLRAPHLGKPRLAFFSAFGMIQ